VLVSGDREKAANVAADSDTVEHAITYDEFHDGEAADAYDAVYIVTPNALHLPFVETAAELDKAVLCEKPMEATVERAERIVEVSDEADIPLMVAYRMHTEPAVRRARDVIDSGLIGEPVFVHGNMSEPILDLVPDPDQWRLDWEMSGGCAVADIGIYSLNTARFLLGADPVEISGSVASVQEEFSDVPDEIRRVQGRLPRPHLRGLYREPERPHGESHPGHRHRGEVRVEPAFYPWDDRALTVSRGETSIDVDFEQVDQMEEEFEYFSHCLLTNEEPYADAEHGLTDIRALKAVYESDGDSAAVRLD